MILASRSALGRGTQLRKVSAGVYESSLAGAERAYRKAGYAPPRAGRSLLFPAGCVACSSFAPAEGQSVPDNGVAGELTEGREDSLVDGGVAVAVRIGELDILGNLKRLDDLRAALAEARERQASEGGGEASWLGLTRRSGRRVRPGHQADPQRGRDHRAQHRQSHRDPRPRLSDCWVSG